MHWLFILFVLFPPSTPVSDRCHTDRNKDHRPRVTCASMGLTSVPLTVDPYTEVLVLQQNQFMSLSWSSYASFPNLHELDLRQNRIGALEPPGPELVNLTILNLSDNRLAHVGPQAFSCAPRLMEVYLGGNQLHSVDVLAFSRLSLLEVVDLSQNKITSLPRDLLEQITSTKLKTLDLEDNLIRIMPQDFFQSKPDLPYVYLSKNPWQCFCEVGYLHTYLEDQSYNIYTHTGPNSIINLPENVTCSAPAHLAGRPIIDLTEAEYCDSAHPTAPPPVTPETTPTTLPATTTTVAADKLLSTSLPTKTPETYHDKTDFRVEYWSEMWTESWLEYWTRSWSFWSNSWFLPTAMTFQPTRSNWPITELHSEPTNPNWPTTELPSKPTKPNWPTTELPSKPTNPNWPTTELTTKPTKPNQPTTEHHSEPTKPNWSTTDQIIITSLVETTSVPMPGRLLSPAWARPWCLWLFVGSLILCVFSALWSSLLGIWLVWAYLTFYRLLAKRTASDAQACAILLGSVERETSQPSSREEGAHAMFRSVLFITKGGEEEEEGEKQNQSRTEVTASRMELSGKEEVVEERTVEGRGQKDVFRKTLYRVFSREEEIEGWREVEESWEAQGATEEGRDQENIPMRRSGDGGRERNRRYTLILREEALEQGAQREVEWLVGEWEMGRGSVGRDLRSLIRGPGDRPMDPSSPSSEE
ncbi:platelet glycoprotein Ib alpha chain isoform X2 [Denticeps clupeoides]|nr:platelet glycoprotein Ib alpha chain-like isoform X2 [Denticeps clupeoides]